MVLASGLYFICSLAVGNYCLGLQQTDYESATVITVPQNTPPAEWFVYSIDSSTDVYNVTVSGQRWSGDQRWVGDRNGVLTAAPEFGDVYWEIKSQQSPGNEAAYTVTLPNNGAPGWVLRNAEPHSPVSVANVPSAPPIYSPNELWSFLPADENFD